MQELRSKVHEDYQNNFRTRNEILETLSYEEIKQFFQDTELNEGIHRTWFFNFYIKQLFKKSFYEIEQAGITAEKRTGMLLELQDLTTHAEFNQTRALVAFLRLEFDQENIDKYELTQMFTSSFIQDDCCAQLAYEKYSNLGK